ncbi:cyclic pyranopterin monophosphate synthase MoaC [Luteolibacter algae]|uniref:cyclic pyranopterin monophosphate synthase n=1 Tax=Luteolibacter algae TaxID=454151 RepID=A0ABW5D8T0_9BACT
MQNFTHLDAEGTARMVDVGAKAIQRRTATAGGFIKCAPETVAALRDNNLPKGDVLTVARIAAIQSAKITDKLIPLCHSLPLDRVDVDFEIKENGVGIRATASTSAKTGVEMEALTAVSIAALTIYDMCKAVDKEMVIDGIELLEKTKQ